MTPFVAITSGIVTFARFRKTFEFLTRMRTFLPLSVLTEVRSTTCDAGSLPATTLAQLVGARFWGPGRFAAALREAVEAGRVRRVGRNRFVAA